MATPINFHFGMGHLLASGGHDVLTASPDMKALLGDVLYFKDALGKRYLKYVKSTAAAQIPKGSVVSMFGDVNGLTNIAAVVLGSALHATTTGLTAGAFQGAECYVTNKAAVAGGAPEGEIAIVRNNTATRIDFEEKYPLSEPLAVNDVLDIKAKNTASLSASGDFNRTVLGTPLVDVEAGNYFWTQYEGPARVIVENTITAAIGVQAMAGATAGKADGVGAGSALNLVIGSFRFAIAANDLVNDFGWINLRVDEALVSTSTLDATA
jgi:hypothetical protein